MDIFSEQTLAGRLSFARSMCPLCGFVRSLLSQSYDGLEIYPVFAVLVMPGDVSICLYQCDWCLKNSDKSPNPVFNANVYRILWPPEQIPQPSQPNQTNYSTVWFSLFWRFCPVQQRDCFFRFVRRGKNYRGGAFSLGGVDKMSAKLTVLLFVCGSWCFSQVYIYIHHMHTYMNIYDTYIYIFVARYFTTKAEKFDEVIGDQMQSRCCVLINLQARKVHSKTAAGIMMGCIHSWSLFGMICLQI